MGTSYGTYLGMQMAKRHPDWLYAYIGIGQVVTMIDASGGGSIGRRVDHAHARQIGITLLSLNT